jgi:MFS family permease
MLTKRTEADERGGILGISAAFLSAANALAPLIGALLFAAFFPSAPFWFWAALMGVLWIVAMRRIPSDRPAQTALPA